MWQKCASLTSGGKPVFFVRKVEDYGPENRDYSRVVWNRQVQAYAATKD